MLLIIIFRIVLSDLMVSEVDYGHGYVRPSPSISFYGFILAEFAVFLTFFWGILWFTEENRVPLSFWLGIPVIGCVLLFSSTVLLDYYVKGILGCSEALVAFLVFCCGFSFMVLRFFELNSVICGFLDNTVSALMIVTVSFHLLHVLVGLIILGWWFMSLRGSGLISKMFILHRLEYGVVYWHFVDFVWLFVYLIVYCR